MRARLSGFLLCEVENELTLLRGVESEAPDAALLLEHGVLTNALEHEVRSATLREIVRPLALALVRERPSQHFSAAAV